MIQDNKYVLNSSLNDNNNNNNNNKKKKKKKIKSVAYSFQENIGQLDFLN